MKKIKQRQNEERMLELQYAARVCFNYAEKIGWYIWVFAIVAELCVFLPNTLPGVIQWCVPTLLGVLVGVLSYKYSKSIENGAKLRNCFDSYVLDLDDDQSDKSEKREVKELAIRIVQKNKLVAEIQMRNTGRDNPPGVKDWYEFKTPLENDAAVCECQKQNRWWTEEMMKGCVKGRGVVAIITILVFICLLVVLPDSRWNVIICSTGLMFRAIERLVAYERFFRVSSAIDAIIQNLNSGYCRSNLVALQKCFVKSRMLPVVGSNRYHKKHASEASMIYSRIVE